MSIVSPAERSGVFISYRRQETSHLAGRLYDRLADRFGEEQVFMDVDTIEPGADFTEVITRAVGTCQVLLAVIGPEWLSAADDQGHRRLDDPDDIVRLEIEAALTRDVRVIPILTEGAVMPRRHEMPESLVGLTRRNAITVRHDSFRYDMERLVTTIAGLLSENTQDADISSANATKPEIKSSNSGLIPNTDTQNDSAPQTQTGSPIRRGWTFELTRESGSRKEFRLSSANQFHIISIDMGWTESLTVDGEEVVSGGGVRNTLYHLEALSSRLGQNVTIRVETGLNIFRVKSITLTIGNQTIVYPRGVESP
jgi:hypothetical protein